jgi:hypothetical protein
MAIGDRTTSGATYFCDVASCFRTSSFNRQVSACGRAASRNIADPVEVLLAPAICDSSRIAHRCGRPSGSLAGLGLHRPRLNADLHVPALLQGVFGSGSWIARQLGMGGGRVRSVAKVVASREKWL